MTAKDPGANPGAGMRLFDSSSGLSFFPLFLSLTPSLGRYLGMLCSRYIWYLHHHDPVHVTSTGHVPSPYIQIVHLRYQAFTISRPLGLFEICKLESDPAYSYLCTENLFIFSPLSLHESFLSIHHLFIYVLSTLSLVISTVPHLDYSHFSTMPH